MIISAGTSNQEPGLALERKPGLPYWTAGFFLAGLTEVECGEKTLAFPPRSCVVLPPDTPYRLTVRTKQRETWMIFDAHMRLRVALPGTRDRPEAISVVFRDSRIWREVRRGLDELMRWWTIQPPQLLLAENAMEHVILLAMREHGLAHEQMPDERIHNVVAFIDERLGQELSVESLARVACLSPSRFAHLFRERTGMAPVKFLELRRIEKARHLLLTTDLSVQQIGRLAGFPNAQHFSIRFHKLTGQSPRSFRQSPRRRFQELRTDDDGRSRAIPGQVSPSPPSGCP